MLMAQDDEATVRAATLSGLATVADNSARWASLVAELASDPDPTVRQRVAVVARHLAPNDVSDILHRLANDPDATVRQMAATELDRRFTPLLAGLDLTGAVVTADAMHTQREHARWLADDRHAAYLFTVKKNQPGLYRQLKQLPWAKVPISDEVHDRGHGRYDIRRLQVVTVLGALRLDFPHAVQAIRVRRRRMSLATGR